MMKLILWRYTALFVILLFFIISISCSTSTVPTTEPTPTEIATMTPNPMLTIPPTFMPLSGEWRFAIDQNQTGEKQDWMNSAFDDSAWATVNVPHTWNVMPEYSDYEGIAWYRRTFTTPSDSQNAHLRLKFEAVFYLARVWLNGQYLGQHEGGYTAFEFDVTSIVKSGDQNVIAIQVDN